MKSNLLRPNLNKKVKTEAQKKAEFELMLKKALSDGKEKFKESENNVNEKIGDHRFKLPYKKKSDEMKYDED